MNWFKQNLRAVIIITIVIVAVAALEARKSEPAEISITSLGMPVAEKASQYEQAKELVSPSGFLNTDDQAITLADLIGEKVILLDFMTYSCINCQRTFPYLNAWDEKYRDAGLQIIGIHTPEFDFEKDSANVAAALEQFGIKFPVVQDNDKGTWRAYNNRYWPRKYIIDIDGYIVYDHIGEGSYAETEAVIQGLLAERSERLGLDIVIPDGTVDPDAISRNTDTTTPELYFGSSRHLPYLSNISTIQRGETTLTITETNPDQLTLTGTWYFSDESARSVSDSQFTLPYTAAEIYLVAGATDSTTITLKIDGEEVEPITIQEQGLYTLTSHRRPESHTLEVSVPAGVDLYTITSS